MRRSTSIVRIHLLLVKSILKSVKSALARSLPSTHCAKRRSSHGYPGARSVSPMELHPTLKRFDPISVRFLPTILSCTTLTLRTRPVRFDHVLLGNTSLIFNRDIGTFWVCNEFFVLQRLLTDPINSITAICQLSTATACGVLSSSTARLRPYTVPCRHAY
jgi:hypothetical protein